MCMNDLIETKGSTMEELDVALNLAARELTFIQCTDVGPTVRRNGRHNPAAQYATLYSDHTKLRLEYIEALNQYVREFADDVQALIAQGVFSIHNGSLSFMDDKTDSRRTGLIQANWYDVVTGPVTKAQVELLNQIANDVVAPVRTLRDKIVKLRISALNTAQTARARLEAQSELEDCERQFASAEFKMLRGMAAQSEIEALKLMICALGIADTLPEKYDPLKKTSTLAKVVLSVCGKLRGFAHEYMNITYSKIGDKEKRLFNTLDFVLSTTSWITKCSQSEDFATETLVMWLERRSDEELEAYAEAFNTVREPLNMTFEDEYMPLFQMLSMTYRFMCTDARKASEFKRNLKECVSKKLAVGVESVRDTFIDCVSEVGPGFGLTKDAANTFFLSAQNGIQTFCSKGTDAIQSYLSSLDTVGKSDQAEISELLLSRRDDDGQLVFSKPSFMSSRTFFELKSFEQTLCMLMFCTQSAITLTPSRSNEISQYLNKWASKDSLISKLERQITELQRQINSGKLTAEKATQAHQDIVKLKADLTFYNSASAFFDGLLTLLLAGAGFRLDQQEVLSEYVLAETSETHYLDWCLKFYEVADEDNTFKYSVTKTERLKKAVEILRQSKNLDAKNELVAQTKICDYKLEKGYVDGKPAPNRIYSSPTDSNIWNTPLKIASIVDGISNSSDREFVSAALQEVFPGGSFSVANVVAVYFLGAVLCPDTKDLQKYKFEQINISDVLSRHARFSKAVAYRSCAFNPVLIFTGHTKLSSCCMKPRNAGATAAVADYLIDGVYSKDENGSSVRPFHTVWLFAQPTILAGGEVYVDRTCLLGTFFVFPMYITATTKDKDLLSTAVDQKSTEVVHGETNIFLQFVDRKDSLCGDVLSSGEVENFVLGFDGWEGSNGSGLDSTYVLTDAGKLSIDIVRSISESFSDIGTCLKRSAEDLGYGQIIVQDDTYFSELGLSVVVSDKQGPYCDANGYGGNVAVLKSFLGENSVGSADSFFSELYISLRGDLSATFAYIKHDKTEATFELTRDEFLYATSFPCAGGFLPFEGKICFELDRSAEDALAIVQEIMAPAWFDSADTKPLLLSGVPHYREDLVYLRQPKKGLEVISSLDGEIHSLELV